MAEDGRSIIRRFVDTVWNAHDTGAIGEFHADPFTQNGETRRVADMAGDLVRLFATYPDLHETIEAVVAEGDQVAYRWVMHGTDAQSGRPTTFRGITINQLADGKIVDDWYFHDYGGEPPGDGQGGAPGDS